MNFSLNTFNQVANQANNLDDKIRIVDGNLQTKTVSWKGKVVELLSKLNVESLPPVRNHQTHNLEINSLFLQAIRDNGYQYLSNLSPKTPLTARHIKLSLNNINEDNAQHSSVRKMTFSSLDSIKSAEFCINMLGMEKMDIPDPTLAKGRSWVRFPDSGLEIHFVDAKNRYGYDEIKENYQLTDKLDQNMTVFTTFMDNHGAILVDDLNPYLNKLTENDIPFLGPVRRADGMYQLYIKIPGHTYLELDSKKTPNKAFPTTTFDKVNFSPEPS